MAEQIRVYNFPNSINMSVEFIMNTLDGTDARPAEPYFIVVEAKREQSYDSDRSKAQLLAQLKALSIR